jgi:hypothetical protein
MAGTPPVPLTYSELYSDPAKNPFGLEDEKRKFATVASTKCGGLPMNP